MPLTPEQLLKIDTARINGASADEVFQSLADAGLDADQAFKEYASTPFKDGRPRAQVNLGDPAEWDG